MTRRNVFVPLLHGFMVIAMALALTLAPYSTARADAPGLQLLSHTVDDGYIVGKVCNVGSTTYASVTISFKVYDSDGSTLGISQAFTNDLAPGETWKFRAGISSRVNSYKFHDLTGRPAR